MNTALRCTTSAAAGNGLATTIKYPQRTTSGVADNGRAKRSSTCDAQRAASRTMSWAQRPSTKYLRAAACIGLGNSAKYLRRSPRGAAGKGLRTTTRYLLGAADIGLGTMIKYLRRTTSAAANKGLGTKVKYLVNQNAGAGSNWVKAKIQKSWVRIQMNPRVV